MGHQRINILQGLAHIDYDHLTIMIMWSLWRQWSTDTRMFFGVFFVRWTDRNSPRRSIGHIKSVQVSERSSEKKLIQCFYIRSEKSYNVPFDGPNCRNSPKTETMPTWEAGQSAPNKEDPAHVIQPKIINKKGRMLQRSLRYHKRSYARHEQDKRDPL